MTDRWERELVRLRTLEPRADLWGVVSRGPQYTSPPPSLRPSQRIIAGVVAVAVFAAAGVFAWDALRPSGVHPFTGRGGTVPTFVIKVLDRGSAPQITPTTEGSSAEGAVRPGVNANTTHVLDLAYGSVVGRWDPSLQRPIQDGSPSGPANREGLTFLYRDSEPALNAGAPVRLWSQAPSTRVVLVPVVGHGLRPSGPEVILSDGDILPRSGTYVLEVRARTVDSLEVWRGPVSIIPPGTFQLLWFNDGSGSHGQPFISMAVNGAHTQAGMLDATGTAVTAGQPTPYPFPDSIPPGGEALTVVSGTPIVTLARSAPLDGPTHPRSQLSYGTLAPPYGRIGIIPPVGPGRVISAPPGDYLFRIHVDASYGSAKHAFVGFLVCPIHVIAPPAT